MSGDRDLARLRATYADLLDTGDDPELVHFLGALEEAHAAPLPMRGATQKWKGVTPRAQYSLPVPASSVLAPPLSLPKHQPGAVARAFNMGAAVTLVVALTLGPALLFRSRLAHDPASRPAMGGATTTKLLYPGSLGRRTGIIAAAANGDDERVLIEGNYSGVAPSPDGQRILAYGDGATAVADLYTGEGQLLRRYSLGETTPLMPYWAPDARHVALFTRSGGTAALGGGHFRTWILDDAGSQELTLGAQVMVGTSSGTGAWSRDGRLFLSVTPGDANGRIAPGAEPELWTTDAAGKTIKRLTRGAFFPFGWSADGGTIYAIAGGGTNDPASGFIPGEALILAIDSHTGTQRTITSADAIARQMRLAPPATGTLPELPNLWTVAPVAVAPDGKQIALWLVPTISTERAQVDYRPYLAVLDGAGQLLAQGYGDPQATPRFTAWIPGSDRLAYAYTQNTAGSIASVGIIAPARNGNTAATIQTGATALIGTSGEETSLRWSPDGQRFAVLRGGQILIASGTDLADVRTLTGAATGWPSWQPASTP